jgi:hypothetical protein
MLNAERFKKQILDVVEDDKKYNFAIKDDDPNAFSNCHSDISCKNCIFTSLKNGKNCLYNRFNWLLSEYKEPVKLTKIEYYILKWAKENTEFKYLVRLKNGNLCAYSEKPFKDNQHRVWANKENVNSRLSMFNDLFEFINCEDLEPTSIEDVLGNCEVIEDDL